MRPGPAGASRRSSALRRAPARFRDRVAQGDVGRPCVRAREFSYPGVGHARSWISDRRISGGGPIADVGVHCIDTLRSILRMRSFASTPRPFRRAFGRCGSRRQSSLGVRRGTLGTVLVSNRAHYRTPLEIVGDKGVLLADDALNVERPIRIELSARRQSGGRGDRLEPYGLRATS